MYSPRQGFTQQELDDFAKLVAAAIIEQHHQDLSPEEHREHHEALAAWIEAQKARQQLFQKITAHVFGWFIVAAITGLGYAVWNFLKVTFKGG